MVLLAFTVIMNYAFQFSSLVKSRGLHACFVRKYYQVAEVYERHVSFKRHSHMIERTFENLLASNKQFLDTLNIFRKNIIRDAGSLRIIDEGL